MKWVLVSLAAAIVGIGAALTWPDDVRLGVVLSVLAIFLARLAWIHWSRRVAAAGQGRVPSAARPSPAGTTASETATFESLTGKYARLLRELAAAHAECLGDAAQSGRIARLTEELAAVHWAVAESRAPDDMQPDRTPSGWHASQPAEPATRRDWVHRCFTRLREHEPRMPTRDAIDIARAFYAYSRWRSAPPEVAVDLEMLELELHRDVAVR
ncbi:MAG: hypothetical protein JSR59_23305 [Proteobacteria bacterium]|nr:hypothetical protein [Pseudomonadota bacterium]